MKEAYKYAIAGTLVACIALGAWWFRWSVYPAGLGMAYVVDHWQGKVSLATYGVSTPVIERK